jgi:deoxyribose-phosphate aldolase
MSTGFEIDEIARMIDHAVLHPAATDQEVVDGAALAARHGVAALCVKPCHVSLARARLAQTGVAVCAVAAFPHGNAKTALKVEEAEAAMEDGAHEIDMVINIGQVLGGALAAVSDEIRAVNRAVTGRGGILKVIFETGYLGDDHIIQLSSICSEHRVAFAKTATGFGFIKEAGGQYACRGAEERHVALMRRHLADGVKIKASGGIGTLEALRRFKALGAERIGTSATGAIMAEAYQLK